MKHSEISSAFGAVLRRLRKEAGLTQEVLADGAGITNVYVSKLESGDQQPTLGTIFSLSATLNIEPNEFVLQVQTQIKK